MSSPNFRYSSSDTNEDEDDDPYDGIFIPTDVYKSYSKEENEIDPYDGTFIDSSIPLIPEEGNIDAGIRHTLRTGARVAETTLGLLGNMREVTKSAGDWLGDKGRSLLGKASLTDEQKKQLQKNPESWDLIGRLLEAIPTSQDIRENVTQKLTGNYLEPQTSGEDFSDELFSDVAGLILPVKGAKGQLKIPFARAIGTALFANTSGEVAKAYGLDPTEAGYIKMGAMLLAGFMGRGGARNHANGLYKEALDMIPEGAVMNGRSVLNQLDSYIVTLKKGGISPQKKPALSLANQLKHKIVQTGGDINVEELPAFRRSINDYRFNRQAGLTDSGRYFLDRFDDILNKQLMDYGKQNPAFLSKYRDANTGLAGFKQSNKIASYISKKVDISKLKFETVLSLGMQFSNSGFVTKAGMGMGMAKAAQIMHRIGKNPVLRQYYLNVLQSSLKDNAPAMIRNLNKLDNEFAEDL
ncbi:MAG: hypothetical protein ACRDAI_05640 [Candidatus Rhabdochlamydia sp.]